jgi:hypothetical protein
MTKKELEQKLKELEAKLSEKQVKADFDNWCWLLSNTSKKGKQYYRVTQFRNGKPEPVKDPNDPSYDLVAFPAGKNGHIAINRVKNC